VPSDPLGTYTIVLQYEMGTLMKTNLANARLLTTTILGFITINLLATRTSASALSDELSGKNSHDFTVSYSVRINNKLSKWSGKQIATEVDKWYATTKQASGVLAPIRFKQDGVKELTTEAESAKGADRVTLVMSVSGSKLLVKQYWPQRDEVRTFLYDGQHTLDVVKGSDAQIFSGFQYNFLRNFVFPGISVAGIPLVTDFTPVSDQIRAYTGEIAVSDGATEVGGLPQYRIGAIKTRVIGGMERVVETHAGSTELQSALHARLVPGAIKGPEQECYYSDYRTIGSGFSLPAKIRLVNSYAPARILPFSSYYSLEYTLLNASAVALPPEQFNLSNQIRSGTIVQSNAKKGVNAIKFMPGKSLQQQFKDDDRLQEGRRLLHMHDIKKNNNAGVFSLIAMITALCGWFFYRRSLTNSRESK